MLLSFFLFYLYINAEKAVVFPVSFSIFVFFSFLLKWVNFFKGDQIFAKSVHFFQVQWTFLKFDELFSNLMNFSQIWWTYFKFDELFFQTQWTFFKLNELFFNFNQIFFKLDVFLKLGELLSNSMKFLFLFRVFIHSSLHIYIQKCSSYI